MKSIPDVEKLIELIDKEKTKSDNPCFNESNKRIINSVVETIKRFIDSLAVEVEEGAIERALKTYDDFLKRGPHGGCRQFGGVIIESARAELATLKEEREYLERVIKHLAIKLVRERGHNDAMEVLDEVTNARIQARKE